MTTTSEASAARASASPRSRCVPWWRCTRSDGANRSISAPHCLSTLIGATTSVGPGVAPSSRSEVSIAIACTVFPRPMSSARIAPIPWSPSSRSQPWPRSWNGKRSNRIAAGVGRGRKRRSRSPASSSCSAGSSSTSPSSSPSSSVSRPETARTRSTIPASPRRRSRKRSARSTSDCRTACQRPPTRTNGSFWRARSRSSSSVSVSSPTASFQSKRAIASVERSPEEGRLVAVRLSRTRFGARTHSPGSRTGTARSPSSGMVSRRNGPTSSGAITASAASPRNSSPRSARSGSSAVSWSARSRRASLARRNEKTSSPPSSSSEAGRLTVGSSAAWSQSWTTRSGGRSSSRRPSRHDASERRESPSWIQAERRRASAG